VIPFSVQARTFSAPSPLVRLLADAASVSVDVSRQDFAERLSQWLGAVDAVTLHGTHQSLKAVVGGSPLGASPHSPAALEAHFLRVRAELVAAVSEPVHLADDSFAPHRRHCLALQHHMGLKIATLRAQVRQVLAHGAAPLRQLAALDAAWEHMLAAREQKLLATVPTLLEKRFEHLRGTGELARYAPEQQTVLLAELNVRLLPVVGLVEAFAQPNNRHQSFA
jgi:hypothetical protein